MIQVFTVAFIMGMAGSVHCLGMCGPLALSLPFGNASISERLLGTFLYNLGRIVTYSCFGLVLGLVGKTISLLGFQQYLSVIAGVVILLFFFLPQKYIAASGKTSMAFWGSLRVKIIKLFSVKSQSSLFVIGILNGLLPCGLVYIAIAAALTTGDWKPAVLFMAAFGLGTLPMMWSISFFGNYIGFSFRQKIRKAYPFMMMLVACLLILRGMGLGIPYVSPGSVTPKMELKGCCHKH